MHKSETNPLYGLVAEFGDVNSLMKAAAAVAKEGYSKTDAYTPIPVEGLVEALGKRPTRIGYIIFTGGLIGFLTAVSLQFITSMFVYPIQIAGRPLGSWPAFIPISFELTVLFTGLTSVFGMLALNGLPRLNHPLFNLEQFAAASRDGFFIAIESDDAKFDLERTRAFLNNLHPRGVYEVKN